MTFVIRKNSENLIDKLEKAGHFRRRFLENCSSFMYVINKINENTGEITQNPVGFYRCKDCMCPICSDIKLYKIKNDLISKIESMDTCNAIFFTISPKRVEIRYIKDLINVLRGTFTKIKNNKFFRNRISGYITCIEFGSITDKNYIHIHMHCVLSMSNSVKGRNFIKNTDFNSIVCDIFDSIAYKLKFTPYMVNKIIYEVSCEENYIPVQTNIQSITSISKIIQKMKYILKSKDLENLILSLNRRSLTSFISQIVNMKYVTRGGIFSKSNTKHNISSADFAAEYKNCYLLNRLDTEKYIQKNKEKFLLWKSADTFYSEIGEV